MHEHNTRRIKKIATCLAIVLALVVWGLIISYVVKTESNRKMTQEIQAKASQSVNEANKTTSTSASSKNEKTETTTEQGSDKTVSTDYSNTVTVTGNNPDKASNDGNQVNDHGLITEMTISKSDLGLDKVDNVSRDDIISVAAPKFTLTKAIDAGTYVTYEGVIYLLPEGHAAGTLWENTTKVATNIGTELVARKSEINGLGETIADIHDDIYGGVSADILAGIAVFSDKTSNGITYTWNDDHSQCSISGATETGAFYNLITSTEIMPAGLQSGKTYDFTFNAKDESISLVILPYANGSALEKEALTVRGTVRYTIPPTWTGVVIRLNVKRSDNSTTINETVDTPSINTVTTGNVESLITAITPITNSAQPLSKNMFPILTLIDDDAISVEQVEKFTAVCESVGVRGTLACITSCWERNPAIVDALKKAEEKGHNAVIHAYNQQPGDCWSLDGYDPEECTKNLVKGMRMMQEAGFSNYKYWVTPFNRDSEDMRKLARVTGCNCRFIGEGHINTIYDSYEIDRYAVYRVGIVSRSVEEIEAIIDRCYDNKGWLVFVTHFYEKTEETAEKLATVVTYAKEKGFLVATAPEAWSYRKFIYDVADTF